MNPFQQLPGMRLPGTGMAPQSIANPAQMRMQQAMPSIQAALAQPGMPQMAPISMPGAYHTPQQPGGMPGGITGGSMQPPRPVGGNPGPMAAPPAGGGASDPMQGFQQGLSGLGKAFEKMRMQRPGLPSPGADSDALANTPMTDMGPPQPMGLLGDAPTTPEPPPVAAPEFGSPDFDPMAKLKGLLGGF